MPSRDKATPTLDVEDVDLQNERTLAPDSADALVFAADEAEAEAAEAEAMAAAARARAKAIRLRRAAAEAVAEPTVEPAPTESEATAAESESQSTTEPDDSTEAVDETAAVDEVEAPENWATDRPGQSRLRGILPVIGATLVVVLSLGLISAGGWMMWQHQKTAADKQHRAEFAAAAAQGVVNLMSLDFNHAKRDVQRIIDDTTGDFKKDFESQAGDFIKVAESSKSITEATVNATAVQSMTQDTANVLVAVTTKVSNAASKDQQPRSWRLSVDVARDGGQIKLAKVEFVP
ncbi:hypothetical protein [Mycobacterium sp. OTB74]|uniref:hypothetical protein n=1 Tax=Mycobacterium sp. OTB74 TaxID=1853452 RepID=UPI00247522CE|nr:hypothetical protein [Mycobacterium sp. OTB74]MDH6246824.1 Mce-associated membrane protein [Mycobacterium sp. OTB74]